MNNRSCPMCRTEIHLDDYKKCLSHAILFKFLILVQFRNVMVRDIYFDFLNLSMFNLPRFSELARRRADFNIKTEDFPSDDAIRLYWPFTVYGRSPRQEARRFMSERFEIHPAVRSAILRTPRWLRAAHLALMHVEGRRP